MSRKIIVASGGHGGITTAMLLSQNGFDVEVYEKTRGRIWGTTGRIFSILVALQR